MFRATRDSLYCLTTSPISGFMLKSFHKRRPSWTGHKVRPPDKVSVMCRCRRGWNQTHCAALISESSQTRVLLRDTTPSCDHFNIPQPRFIPVHLFTLRKKNAKKPVQPLLQYAAPHYCMPHHLPCFAVQCEYLFARTVLLSIPLLTTLITLWRGSRDRGALRDFYLSTWSRFPDTPSPPIVYSLPSYTRLLCRQRATVIRDTRFQLSKRDM